MGERINKKVLFFVGLFAIVSILSIYCASLYTSSSLGNLELKQTLWYIAGIVVIFGVVKLKNKFFYQTTWLLYWFGISLLVLLLLFGKEINNSKCWFIIPGIGSFQPSEFMKLFIMLALGQSISEFKAKNISPSVFQEFLFLLKSLLIVFLPSLLTFLQPDTGAVIMYLVIYIFMMFVAGIRLRWFMAAIIFAAIIFGSIGAIYLTNEKIFVDIFGTSLYYRIERLFMWKNGTGLQLENAISAIGSAGMFGHGFNNTPIYFPEAATDFIFAVFASNFGFIAVLLFLSLIVAFDGYVIFLMLRTNKSFNKNILAGILGMLLFQQIQNIGMTIGIFPITGITLPFISYGGSSLISYMIIIGIIINIASEKKERFKYQ